MFEVYKDAAGEWRWRLSTTNGKILADSGEGYRRRGAAVKAISTMKALASTAGVVEVLPMKSPS